MQISFTTVLAILFVALKLTGFIAWSWLWVLAPLWIGFLLWLLLVIFLVAIGEIG
jgi:hypothetical protein